MALKPDINADRPCDRPGGGGCDIDPLSTPITTKIFSDIGQCKCIGNFE
jgi:hypothetical protein